MSVRVSPSPFGPLARRSFLRYAAKSMLGVSVYSAATAFDRPGARAEATSAPAAGGTAKSVIYLFMAGAMSHVDTFDLKSDAAVRGQTKPIDTNVPGMTFGGWLPRLATQADKLTVIRSLHTGTGDHDQGRYLMRTGYEQIASIRHPTLGAWATRLQGRRNGTLPDSVSIAVEPRHPGAGFLDPSHSPLPIGDPSRGLENAAPPANVNDDLRRRRTELKDVFGSDFRSKYRQKPVEACEQFYRQATDLMSSEELAAFSLADEPDRLKDEYGQNTFGQGCLLARRLVEAGTRFVEVAFDGWDHHADLYKKFPGHAAVLDSALAALLKDLHERGLLKDTLVVLATEFGRTPEINQSSGRDHHPGVFCGLMAGGGTAGGRYYGSSDENAYAPADDPTSVADFNATIAFALGLPLEEEVFSKDGRPFKVAGDGKPVTALF